MSTEVLGSSETSVNIYNDYMNKRPWMQLLLIVTGLKISDYMPEFC